MAYVAQTSENLKARYPEFESVDDALITLVLSEAERETNEDWVEADRAPAVLALVAHWLSAQGVLRTTQVTQNPDGSMEIGGIPVSGRIKAHSIGDARVEFATPSGGSSSTGSFISAGVPYKSTIYGLRWLELAARNASANASGAATTVHTLLRY